MLSPFFLYLSCFTVPIMFCYYVSSMLFPKPFLPGIACNMAAVSRLCSRHVLKPVNGDILFCLAFPSLLSVIITFGLIKYTAHNSALVACIIMEPEVCLYSCIIMEPSNELERLRSVYPTLRWRRGRFMHFGYLLALCFDLFLHATNALKQNELWLVFPRNRICFCVLFLLSFTLC